MKKYHVGVRKGIASWEPGYAVNDGKVCFGLFWDRGNAELTRDLLNQRTATKRQRRPAVAAVGAKRQKHTRKVSEVSR